MSKVFSTYFSAVRLLFFKWKSWVVVCIANLIFALLIALPFGRLLDKLGAHSEAPLMGLSRFDMDFIADVINNYGSELHLLIGQVALYGGLYLLLNIFLSGGVIESYVHLFGRFSLSDFLSNCAKHFWRLLRLALYFIGAQVFVALVLFSIYTKLGMSPFELESDTVLVTRTRVMGAIFIAVMAWVDMVNEYCKVKVVVSPEKRFILPQLIGMKFFCLKHFFRIFFLFLLCVLTFLAILGLYSMINNVFTMQSTGTMVLALLIGQIYIFFRVGTRLLFTSAATDYMRSHEWGA